MVNRPASELHVRSFKSQTRANQTESVLDDTNGEIPVSAVQPLAATKLDGSSVADSYLHISQAIEQGLKEYTEFQPRFLQAIRAANESISHITEFLARRNTIDVHKLVKEFFEASRELLDEAQEFAARDFEALNEEGFPLRSDLRDDLTLQLWGLHKVNPEDRQEIITQKLLEFVDTQEFVNEFESYKRFSPSLQARWPIIRQALETHEEEKFLVSIPCLLAQLEGVLVDNLVMRKILIVKDQKVYKRTGRPLDPKKDELRGLYIKASMAKGLEFERFNELPEYVMERLTGERNSIQHGQNNEYGRAELSVKLILLIFGLARDIHISEGWKRLAAAQARRNQSNS